MQTCMPIFLPILKIVSCLNGIHEGILCMLNWKYVYHALKRNYVGRTGLTVIKLSKSIVVDIGYSESYLAQFNKINLNVGYMHRTIMCMEA